MLRFVKNGGWPEPRKYDSVAELLQNAGDADAEVPPSPFAGPFSSVSGALSQSAGSPA